MIFLTVGVLAGLTVALIYYVLSFGYIAGSVQEVTTRGTIARPVAYFFSFLWGFVWRVVAFVIVGGVIGFFVASAFGNVIAVEQEPIVVAKYKLVAARTDSQLGGRFFLGSGTLRNELVYIYYYEYDGGFRQGQLTPNHNEVVVIYEEDRQDGLLIKFNCTVNKNMPKIKSLWQLELPLSGSCKKQGRYEFHVPRGSVVRDIRFE